eukprot:TRINITY_DN3119_c0_g2_i2.p1 TRINITY_DN3119_c0_g2~~TRINITY_DN3119_c0_g2_i2.p1  ORF type:complete len:1172 (-),score=84.83 TRINITY_DN3119_c0_g2_i2:87-3602(-)
MGNTRGFLLALLAILLYLQVIYTASISYQTTWTSVGTLTNVYPNALVSRSRGVNYVFNTISSNNRSVFINNFPANTFSPSSAPTEAKLSGSISSVTATIVASTGETYIAAVDTRSSIGGPINSSSIYYFPDVSDGTSTANCQSNLYPPLGISPTYYAPDIALFMELNNGSIVYAYKSGSNLYYVQYSSGSPSNCPTPQQIPISGWVGGVVVNNVLLFSYTTTNPTTLRFATFDSSLTVKTIATITTNLPLVPLGVNYAYGYIVASVNSGPTAYSTVYVATINSSTLQSVDLSGATYNCNTTIESKNYNLFSLAAADPNAAVAYLSDGYRFIRLNLNYNNSYETGCYPSTGKPSNYWITDRTLSVVDAANSVTVYFYNVPNCNSPSQQTCSSCQSVDPQYCGWCLAPTDNRTASCQRSFGCSATTEWFSPASTISTNNAFTCPTYTSLTPSNASVDSQNASVTVTGIGFTSSRNYYLQFTQNNNGVAGTSTNVQCFRIQNSTTMLRCPVFGLNRGNYTTRLLYNSASRTQLSVWDSTAGPNPFIAFSCNVATCAECSLYCNWCLNTATCQATNIPCTSADVTANTPNRCPGVVTPNPNSDLRIGGTTITINSGYYAPSITYSCLWNGTTTTSATYVSSTQITCLTPSFSQTGAITLRVIVGVNVNISYQEPFFPFNIYSCGLQKGCAACTQNLVNGLLTSTKCVWCASTATCNDLPSNNQAPACSDQCPTVTQVVTPAALPGFASLTRRSLSNYTVSVISNNQWTTSSNYSCQFTNQIANLTYTTAATVVSASSISCSISPVNTVGNYSVFILDNSGYVTTYNYTTVNSIYFFQCQNFGTCSGCGVLPVCGWCVGNVSSCTESIDCPSTTSAWLSPCPLINKIRPFEFPTKGGNITLGGTGFTGLSTVSPLQCEFRSGGDVQSTNAYYNSNTTNVTCSTPNATMSNYTISLVRSAGQSLSATPNGTLIYFFDCPDPAENGTVLKNPGTDDCTYCTQAVNANPRCGYCSTLQMCTGRSFCPSDYWKSSRQNLTYSYTVNDTTYSAPIDCPSISSISPPAIPAGGNAIITITGTGFPPDYPLIVVYDTSAYTSRRAEPPSSPATVVSPNQITTVSPNLPGANGPITLRVQTPSGDTLATRTYFVNGGSSGGDGNTGKIVGIVVGVVGATVLLSK